MWSISLRISMLFLWIGGLSWSFVFANVVDAYSELTDSRVSAGGNSYCIAGNIKLTVTAQNLQLNYTESSNQLAVTELIVELLQVNSTFAQRVVTGPRSITGTYNIYSSLCVPANATAARKIDTVQFLTHADTLSSRYWDIAPEYSYIDAATAAGYAVFSYDRIGYGNSDHPDPIQVVQGPLHREIAHALVQLLRQNRIGRNNKFSKVVGVGHAAGSVITQAVTAKYPGDFDAVILTGLSLLGAGTDLALAAFNLQIARQANEKFRDLSFGYLTQANAIGVQFGFFRYPNFDPNIFELIVRNRQTIAIGDLLTLDTIAAPAPGYTGPVDVVLGENDMAFCRGDCTTPTDQSAAVQPILYPNAGAGSSNYLVPGAGHLINAHFGARAAWDHQLNFLKTNGL